MRAALAALSNGSNVVIISKSVLGKAHTVMAEGGIAASVGNVDSKDNWQVHFSDTIVEGVYLSNWRMAELLAKEAPERVFELERFGAIFDRTEEGKIMQRAFGNQQPCNSRRIYHACWMELYHFHVLQLNPYFVSKPKPVSGRFP